MEWKVLRLVAFLIMQQYDAGRLGTGTDYDFMIW